MVSWGFFKCFLSFCWSLSGSWKRGANRIREHWFWSSRYLLHISKCTFMSWLLDSLDLPSQIKDTHRLMSRVDFSQRSVVSFVIKKRTYLWWKCIYLVILLLYANIFSLFMIWKFRDFVLFLNFLLTLRATWII